MTPARRRVPFLALLLGFIFLLFISLLVVVWIATDRADPVILDERGAPR